MRNILMILVIGVGGVAALLSLGTWQIQRLHWKEAILTEIEGRIGAEPVPLPAAPDPERDRYRPVVVEGTPGQPVLRVLSGLKNVGAGHMLIVPLTTPDGRRVMADIGFLPDGAPMPALDRPLRIVGNLQWPRESDSFTPDPDMSENLWFARDVPKMAEVLETEQVLVVRRTGTEIPGVTPVPVDTAGIPNDHLQYAITWFGLAAIWLAMTGILVYRMRKSREG